MRSEASIEIDCPIDQVFELTNKHVAAWSPVCVEDEVLEEKPGHVGTTFCNVTEDRGKRMEFQGTVTKWDAPRLSAVDLKGDMFDIQVEYSFEDLGDRTSRMCREKASHVSSSFCSGG